MYRAAFDILGGDRGMSEPSTVWHESIYFPYGSGLTINVWKLKCGLEPAGPFPYSLTKDLCGKGIFVSIGVIYIRIIDLSPAGPRCLHGPTGWSHHLLDFYVVFSTHCPVAMFNMATIKNEKPSLLEKKDALLEMNHLKIGFPTKKVVSQPQCFRGNASFGEDICAKWCNIFTTLDFPKKNPLLFTIPNLGWFHR